MCFNGKKPFNQAPPGAIRMAAQPSKGQGRPIYKPSGWRFHIKATFSNPIIPGIDTHIENSG